MPTWLKVILVIVLAALIAIVIAAFFAAHWFRANRGRLLEEGAAVRREGVAYGQHRDARQCIDEALTRLRSSPDFTNELRARVFLSGCLSTASRSGDFCDSVPRQREIVAAAEWTVNECRSRDAAEISRCSRVLQEVVKACEPSHTEHPLRDQTSK